MLSKIPRFGPTGLTLLSGISLAIIGFGLLFGATNDDTGHKLIGAAKGVVAAVVVLNLALFVVVWLAGYH